MTVRLFSPVSRDTSPSETGLAAVAAVLVAAGTVALLIPAGPVRLVLLLGFFTAAPGAAIVSHLRIADRVLAAALSITFSLALTGLGAASMVWSKAWHPYAATVLALVFTAAVALARLRRPDVERADVVAPEPLSTAVHPVLSPTLFAVATGVWLVTVLRADPERITLYGLTWGLGVPFVAAIVMVGVGFGVELFGRTRTPVLLAGVGAMALLVWATAPLLVPVPEYPWVYKHIGVVELIQRYGRVIDPDDIYQRWPVLFAAAAQLSDVAGVPSIRFAGWSTPYFGLIDALMIAAIVRGFTRDVRTVFLAVFLFSCCLWVDQNYFSPQAYAYALSLGFFALLTHGCRGLPGSRPAGWPNRLRLWLARDAPAVGDRPQWPLLVAITLVFAAVTAAHQLTPYLLLFGVGVLTVLGLIRPFWLMIVLAVVAGGYFVPRMGGVSSQYNLFDGFDLFSNAAGTSSGWGTRAQEFSAIVARGLSVVVWLAALAVGWRHRRGLGRIIVPLVLGFTPFLLLFLQSYGGEAIYRVYLFSVPWCAMLAASWWSGARRAGLVSGAVLAVLAIAALQGLQGQFALHVVPPADLRAARYLEAQAPAGSTMTMLAPAFPARLTADYGNLNPGHSVDPSITDQPSFKHVMLDADQLPAIGSWAASYGGTETFLVITPLMQTTAEYFGNLPDGSVEALRRALDESDDWSVYYRSGAITIYRLERA
ncbi:hypothetical protein [Cryptosporangium japonicum]|uniref:Glycosyltransferase RgtA/B/C/D-like domain-containing protein n=1 Tax=Cryptosporangium japonicum TaxID=80872 RepID=A0ABP3DFX3_9ACTN